MPPAPSDLYAQRSRFVINKLHASFKHELDDQGPFKEVVNIPPKPTPQQPVCIVGAGAAGLYTALIFDSLGIPYEILEAHPTRVGGRLFTHYFSDPSKYEYYDVGAMRFPFTPFMKRTFDLVLHKLQNPPQFIDYYMTANAGTTYDFFNGVQVKTQDLPTTANPFHIRAPYVPGNLLQPSQPQATINAALQAPRQLFVDNNIQTGLDLLYRGYDQYSMRSWLQQPPTSLTGPGINYCETLDKSTGWYDRALTETVLESLAFDWPGPASPPDPQFPNLIPGNWYCFDKGSSTLPEAMLANVKTKPTMDRRVTAIAETTDGINVTWTANAVPQPPKKYAGVIATTTLGCLAVMDLTGCNLPGGMSKNGGNYSQWAAVRSLQYGPSIKIGIRFKSPWWQNPNAGGIVGGQSFTDLPLRTVVYPSYPPGSDTKSNTLIVSYCWTQDAERLGALIYNGRTNTGEPVSVADPELINLVINNLAQVHQVNPQLIWEQYDAKGDNMFAWSWTNYKHTMGAYAFFGPQQFADTYDGSRSNMDGFYSNITLPAANNMLYIAGEATSSCHAWVAGALDSAWRAVDQFLVNYDYDASVINKFHTLWGQSEYWDENMARNHAKLARLLTRGR